LQANKLQSSKEFLPKFYCLSRKRKRKMTEVSLISDENRLYSAVPELVRRLRDDPVYTRISDGVSVIDARRRGVRVREVAEEIAQHWEIDRLKLIKTCAGMIGEIRGIHDHDEAWKAFQAEVFEERAERLQAIR
jgi:precorrin-4 methylase